MKRILIFALAYHPFVGGAEVAMKEITDRFDPQEYQFDMITLRFDRSLPRVERMGNITVHRIGFATRAPKISDRTMPLVCKMAKVLFPLTSFVKAQWLHLYRRYDIVWALMANQAGFGALFFKLTHPRIPYVLELQDGRAFAEMQTRQPLLRWMWPLYRQIYLRADRIKAISNYIAKEVRTLGYEGLLEIIPNAVDTEKFSAPMSDARLMELKAKYDKRLGDIFLFTASRLVLSRGVEDIIRALPHLPLEVKLLVAGDGEDRFALERIAKDERVEGRVIFAGHVDHKDLPAYLKISDIFVRPSLIEGLGNAFLEAMAAEIPIIGTRVGGIPDFLTEGQTGLFCEVRDPQSIARAVRRYIDDPALVARVVRNAQALVAERYEWNMVADMMRENVFDPLIHN